MAELAADGPIPEMSDEAAAPGYAGLPPSFGELAAKSILESSEMIGSTIKRAMYEQEGTIPWLARASARGAMAEFTGAQLYGHVGPQMPQNFLADAKRDLGLNAQEQNLYRFHLSNLSGFGKVQNADGTISTIRDVTVERDGRTYVIPSIWEGRQLPADQAIARAGAQGWDKWPSYDSQQAADARYESIHRYMDRDVQAFQQGPTPGDLTVAGVDKLVTEIEDQFLPADLSALPSPKLSKAEATARHPDIAKAAPDLFSDGMPQGVVDTLAEAKENEIEREGVFQRYGNAHSWPVNFAARTALTILDPVNAAALLVPGVGEEAIFARLGTGMAARLAARGLAGATAAGAGMAAITGVHYGLSQATDGDYGLREAFLDLASGAAFGAIIHSGIGGLREAGILKPDVLMRARSIVDADAVTSHDATSAAIAEISDGREVNVEPIFAASRSFPEVSRTKQRITPLGETVEKERDLHRSGFIPSMSQPELETATHELYGKKEGEEAARAAVVSGARPEPRGIAPVAAPGNIDATHDVVSGANSARDPNGPIYIDKDIPQYSPILKDRNGQAADLHKYLAIHESVERDDMARWAADFKAQNGRDPTEAERTQYYSDVSHPKVATAAERAAVEADGVNWQAYTHEIDGYLDHIENKKVTNPPPGELHVDSDAAIGHHRAVNKVSNEPAATPPGSEVAAPVPWPQGAAGGEVARTGGEGDRATELDRQIADAKAAAAKVTLTPEDHADIAAATNESAAADLTEQAYMQAADCLKIF